MKKINITDFVKNIHEMRQAIHENLIALMENHKSREVDCFNFNERPIVFNGLYDDCMTLNSIEVVTTPSLKCIHFNCSDTFIDDYTTPNSMDIELLFEVYKWVMANEEELFKQDND